MHLNSSRCSKVAPSCLLALVAAAFQPGLADAQVLEYSEVTDLPGGPGEGRSPSINNSGDIAFWLLSDPISDIYFYDRSEGTFLNVQSLPGAPAQGWYPKMNNLGNIVFIEPTSRNLWLFERATQALTNLATLAGYPGDTAAFGVARVYNINDANQISFHTGDRNVGDVYLYDHATGDFLNVSDQPGAPGRGRENTINNAGQIAYMGFPQIHVYDISSGTTTLIDEPPTGSPGGTFAFNDEGDLAFFGGGVVEYYDASEDTLLDLSTLPGYPPIMQPSAGFENDISDSGEVTFWQDMVGLFYFDPVRQTFTQMTDQSIVPEFGMATSINDFSEIALGAGQDVYLGQVQGTDPRLRLQVNGVRPEPAVVTTSGPTRLTLDVKPGTFTEPVDWYYLIGVNGQLLLWVTSAGFSLQPAPLFSAIPPVELDALPLLDASPAPGTTLVFGMFLIQDGTVVAQDFITSEVPQP